MEQPRSRRDSPRIVGRFEERLAFHCIARRVYLALPQLHHDCDFPHQAFDHINLNFLRELGSGECVVFQKQDRITQHFINQSIKSIEFHSIGL